MVAVNGFDAPSSELDNNNDDDYDDENDDDDDDRKLYELTEDKSDIVEDEGFMQLGGAVATPAFALLAGMHTSSTSEGFSNNNAAMTIPIDHLPCTLGFMDKLPLNLMCFENDDVDVGENHDNINKDKTKDLVFCIYYRDGLGGRVGAYKGGMKMVDEGGQFSEMVYMPHNQEKDIDDDILPLPDRDHDNNSLHLTGFFAIQCLSSSEESKITVNGRILTKGRSARIVNRTPIGIGKTHRFYFLLPTDDTVKSPLMVNVSMTTTEPMKTMKSPIKLERILSHSFSGSVSGVEDNNGAGRNEDAAENDTTPTPPPSKKLKKETTAMILPAYDEMSDVEVLRILSNIIETTSTWDNNCQKLGSALALRACKAASLSSTIRGIATKLGGVTQKEILDWMTGDPVWGQYERLMLQRIEKKSFMMSMGKACLRAGYTKNDVLSGRAIRWNLPLCNNNSVVSGVSSATVTNSLALVDVNNGVLPPPSSSVNDGISNADNQDGPPD